ncbi:hypothetical protein G8770_12105 [Aestuariicella hydrocarbonica]|uniref:DUF2232 domain-containing protein n=1 Tax=Pseudomaricurvus hydrocarbonicus TaxID=1470433 RepID=A0A9E5JT26_9GAMM|nr:hypothetical protein [Aestuariicella hydrocarbonica]NHO66288.1 hypothetical protein [Aestuariicella hydrocarbonica]
MRALAEFIMRGRAQASVVALVGSWFPLISPAAVALVTLRRGPFDGLMVLLWAVLPALVTFVISDMGPLMPVVTIAGLLATMAFALLLRSSSSWGSTLMGLVAFSALAALSLTQLIPDPVAGMTEALGKMLEQMQAQAPDGTTIVTPSETFVVGLIAYVMAVSSFMSLLLARWWQALLYNPGGLQQEFHQLRLKPLATLTCFAAVFYCWQRGLDYQHWAGLFGFPLLVVGAAIAHHVVKTLKLGGQWLILFYLVLVFASPLVLVIAVLDTWTDFRSRIEAKSGRRQERDRDDSDD